MKPGSGIGGAVENDGKVISVFARDEEYVFVQFSEVGETAVSTHMSKKTAVELSRLLLEASKERK